MARKKRKKITKFRIDPKDIQKANRKGNREAELELNKGFTKGDTPHKNKRAYTRKKKHKSDDY